MDVVICRAMQHVWAMLPGRRADLHTQPAENAEPMARDLLGGIARPISCRSA